MNTINPKPFSFPNLALSLLTTLTASYLVLILFFI